MSAAAPAVEGHGSPSSGPASSADPSSVVSVDRPALGRRPGAGGAVGGGISAALIGARSRWEAP